MLTMTIDEQKIRHDCVLFLARKGYGALTHLANASGLAAESVRRVRQGSKVDLDTLIAVQNGLTALGWYNEPQEDPPRTAQEAAETYRIRPNRDVASIFAGELRIMAEKLESDALDPIHKGQEFREFIANLYKTIDTKVAAVEKIGKGDN